MTGASAAAYRTLAVGVEDSGEGVTVAVSDAGGTVMSSAAVLTIGPRSPKAGGLRCKGVDFCFMLTGDVATNLCGYGEQSFTNVYGSPLEVGSAGACALGLTGWGALRGDCPWVLTSQDLPAGTSWIDAIQASDGLETLLQTLLRQGKQDAGTGGRNDGNGRAGGD